MNIQEKVEKLRSLKKEFAEKKALLAKAKMLREKIDVTNLSKLLENDLEQAKLILAARDVCDRLQKIAEHLAELGAEEIMPLADAMKGAFGPESAATFEHAANTNIQNALETVRQAKDSINTAILQVEGKIAPQNDMNAPVDPNVPNDMAVANTGAEQAPAAGDTFAGADAAAGAPGEPLGRAVKSESRMPIRKEGKSYKREDDDDDDVKSRRKEAKDKRDARKEKANEALNLTEAGENLLKTMKLEDLTDWLLGEAAKTMTGGKFLRFTQNVTSKAVRNPVWMAGYIGEKRLGAAKLREMLEADRVVPRSEKLARGIATVIETNIQLFGKGKAAQVVENFTNDLVEDEGPSVLESFSQIYGCDPGSYSVQLARKMREDGPIAPSGTQTATSPMDDEEKQNTASAVSQIAGKMATDPSVVNQPVASAMAGMDPNAQSALKKVAGDNSSGTVSTIGQLIKAADDKMKENQLGSGVTEARRGNKGEHVDKDAKNVGKPKKARGTNAKKTIAKEELMYIGERKLHHKHQHHHPSYVLGVGAYYAGLPRAYLVDGYAGSSPGHACKGYDTAASHDAATDPGGDAGGAPAAAPVGESRTKVVSNSKKKSPVTTNV